MVQTLILWCLWALYFSFSLLPHAVVLSPQVEWITMFSCGGGNPSPEGGSEPLKQSWLTVPRNFPQLLHAELSGCSLRPFSSCSVSWNRVRPCFAFLVKAQTRSLKWNIEDLFFAAFLLPNKHRKQTQPHSAQLGVQHQVTVHFYTLVSVH